VRVILVVSLALAALALAGTPALAAKPVDFRGDIGDKGEALTKGGLTLKASCAEGDSGPAIRVVAVSSENHAYISASMSEVGRSKPIVVREPDAAKGQRVTLLDGTLAGVGGTVNYTDPSGGQVSATFHADTGDVLGGAYDCVLGGTALKNIAIDYRAKAGTHRRTLLNEDGIKLKAACTGTGADPQLDLDLSSEDPLISGASWGQRGNPSALTTYSSEADPLVGLEDKAQGTITAAVFESDAALSLVFQSDEGAPQGNREDCLFGATLATSDPFEAFVFSNSSGSIFELGGLDVDLSCAGGGTGANLSVASATPDSQLTVSHSQGGLGGAITAVDTDADPGDPALGVTADFNGGGGTMTLTTPAGGQASAAYTNSDVGNCLMFGNAAAVPGP
jgi:hypothetical protein